MWSFAFCRQDVQLHEYRYVMTVDSTGNLTNKARIQADSLITAVKHHERSINEHYDYILQQKDDDQRLYTVIGTILSVVVAVFGFFGYKNFRSIEEKSLAVAKEEVEEKMREFGSAQKDALKNLQAECRQTIQNETKRQFRSFKEKEMINAISDVVNDTYRKDIESKLEKVDDFASRVDGMENTLQSIIARMDELEVHQSAGGTNKESSASLQRAESNDHDTSVIDMINNHDKNCQTDNRRKS